MYYSENEVLKIKATYPPGTQIVVNEINDPIPIPSGTKGKVEKVDDIGTIHCTFENGRRFGIIPGEDDFSVIEQDHLKSIQKTRVFVDMDGCLAEFKSVNRFEDLFEKNYFLNLRPHANIVETVKALNQNPNYEVYILSSVLQESGYAKQEKMLWLEQYLPELNEEQIIFSQCNKSKVAFVPNGIKETDILLDDYNLNLKEWKLAGARPIKVVNGINDKHHSWSGLRINYMESASDSINTINSVANALQYKPILPNEVNIENSLPTLDFLY